MKKFWLRHVQGLSPDPSRLRGITRAHIQTISLPQLDPNWNGRYAFLRLGRCQQQNPATLPCHENERTKSNGQKNNFKKHTYDDNITKPNHLFSAKPGVRATTTQNKQHHQQRHMTIKNRFLKFVSLRRTGTEEEKEKKGKWGRRREGGGSRGVCGVLWCIPLSRKAVYSSTQRSGAPHPPTPRLSYVIHAHPPFEEFGRLGGLPTPSNTDSGIGTKKKKNTCTVALFSFGKM